MGKRVPPVVRSSSSPRRRRARPGCRGHSLSQPCTSLAEQTSRPRHFAFGRPLSRACPIARNFTAQQRIKYSVAGTSAIAFGDCGRRDLIARSVARDPDYFLRIFDELNAAGWSLADIDQPALSATAERFDKICRECDFAFVHEADRLAVANAEKLPVRFSGLLVMGFNGTHWPLWPLLHAAVKSSLQAAVVLNDPRDEARDVDETWVGTWEEVFGEAEPVGEPQGGTGDHSPSVHFVVGRDTTDQARAIVALTAKFLCEKNCERIGILFPQKDALPRLVARFLGSAQIAHNDGIAHLSPSVFDNDAWRVWLELQENPRLKSLSQFLHAIDAEIFAQMSILEVEEKLRDAYSGVLIDDIEVLREF